MALVEALHYSLASTESHRWTTAQEKSISVDYPFDTQQEAVDQFVNRTYLQFLWLPQSIMPLQLLVPSLRRVVDLPSSSQSPHSSLHFLLDPLLQTTRAITKKYHVELVQILQDGGGAGEIEEIMMWHALHHEKTNDQELFKEAEAQEHWMIENWRQEWLERLEEREVQIQILLYMTKLSLPGPAPVAAKSKKRKHSRQEVHVPSAAPEERLESFMDKLSMRQLAGHLATNGPQLNHNERDWAQLFCEDVVEPLFKPHLPELCSLLRSKVFPNSPFSDTDTPTVSRSPSPELQVESQEPEPAPTTTLKTNSRSLARARSRSLSMSLAQEREQRERSVSLVPGKKRSLNREVSMTRGFKPKPRMAPKPTEAILDSQPNVNGKPQHEKAEVILVEETPQKPRVVLRNTSQSQLNCTSSNAFVTRQDTQSLFGSRITETDDDDAWMLDSSPDVLLLQPGPGAGGDSDDEFESVAFHTPSKRPRRRD